MKRPLASLGICSTALKRIAGRIDLDQIKEIIESSPSLNEVQREFYLTMVTERKEKIIEPLRLHIRDISFRTYYRKRKVAVEALSSVLWGYTARDSLRILRRFFPCDLERGGQR